MSPSDQMVVLVVVVVVVGPAVGHSFIICAFSDLKKVAGWTDGPTDRLTDRRTRSLSEMRGRI